MDVIETKQKIDVDLASSPAGIEVNHGPMLM